MYARIMQEQGKKTLRVIWYMYREEMRDIREIEILDEK